MIINSLLCLCHGKFYYAVCCSNYVDVWICSSMLSVSLRIEMSDEVYQKGARNNMKKKITLKFTDNKNNKTVIAYTH